MDRTAAIFILLITALALFGIIPTDHKEPGPVEDVNNEELSRVTFEEGLVIECEVVTTESEKVKGLMDRQELEENHGMLFVYNSPEEVTIWMKDTYLDLDIIFISDGKVTRTYEANAGAGKPDSELVLYPSYGEVDYVVEMEQGLARTYGIGIGSEVEILF